MTRDNIIKALDKFPTPLYVFEAEKLTDRVDYLKKSLPSGVSLCYAVKANTFVVKELIGHVDRFEICSPGEAYICDAQAVPRAEMVISGVYKDPHFIEELFAKGEKVGHFTAESKEQFELIRFLSEKYKIKTKLLLRLSSGNQFGMDNSVLCEIIKNRSEYEYLDICGVQYFSGTQKTSIKKLRREIRQLDNLITKLRSDFDYDCRELEIGPGFPACYFPEDEFDEDELLRGFSEALNEMENRPKISLELGRSIAASCGSFLTRIVDKKTNCCENYAIVDGGIHQLVYFGQMMAMKKPYHSLYPEIGRASCRERV